MTISYSRCGCTTVPHTHTQRAYRADIARFAAAIDKPLPSVTLGDLQAFSDRLSHLTPSTKARTLPAVKSLLSFGHLLGYLTFDVGRAVRLPRLRLTLAERILRAYVVTTLYRPTLPGTEGPALVLPRRQGYVSVHPERSFSQGLVRSLANRLPDEQRHILEDLAGLSDTTAATGSGAGMGGGSTLSPARRGPVSPLITMTHVHGGYMATYMATP